MEAGRLELACCRFGAPEDPAIVLIRGLGTQLIEWPATLVQGLVEAGLQVVIFDNRDAGHSSKVEVQYTLSDMAADVVALLDSLDIPRAHVLGISLGGMVAQLTAVEHPERVRTLFSVMSNTGDPALPGAAPEIRERLLRTAQGRAAVIELDAENREIFGSPGYPEPLEARRAAAERAYDRCYCPEGVARQMRAVIADGSRRERLRGLSVPALVIHGADDALVPPSGGEDTAACIPGAELELVPGMGHNIPAALGADIAQRVVGFIRRYAG